mmetsp:Transcript_14166/g.25343  ORF Transcript_14166/g.25343 Transcript_14166/m.25343 type:complete len:237 (+) Transcript_14166:161-871(+)
MMEIYYAPTPNGWKVTILLEELVEAGLLKREDFKVVPVNLAKGEQFESWFLEISPNGRMPALRDGDLKIFESGAVLMYIAEKCGAFMPASTSEKFDVLSWLFWQVGGLGPMAGQVSHFVNYAPEVDPKGDHSYSLERYQREFKRLLNVMDKRLEKNAYLGGQSYSIADMASFPWVIPYKRFGVESLEVFPHLQRWFSELKSRPGVSRGVDVLKRNFVPNAAKDAEARKILFQKSNM